jgi:hypothetical protein
MQKYSSFEGIEYEMPCCGITIDYIYARLKAEEIPGSGTADRLLDELLSVDEKQSGRTAQSSKPEAPTPKITRTSSKRGRRN